MPLVEKSAYTPPFFLRNGHFQTVFPRFLLPMPGASCVRERIDTPDGDFIDADFYFHGGLQAVLVLHGLEGSSRRQYIRAMAYAFLRRGRDVVAMNYRGCSGEPNRTLGFYHQGSTADLHLLINHILEKYDYEGLALAGFSLGGNLLLKYLGDGVFNVPDKITGAAAISVPCDLQSCAEKLASPSNAIYMKYFLKSLHRKIKEKKRRFPGLIDDRGFEKIRTFQEFDDRYTAPIHGFSDARDYYWKCSCRRFLSGIQKPALLINALDDPFFTERCYPYGAAEKNDYLYLETPTWGGHVGFAAFNGNNEYWHETRAAQFICAR